MTNTFLIVALVALVAVAVLRPQPRLGDGRPRPLRIVASLLVLAGVIALEQPGLGYGLMGAGAVALAVDLALGRRRKRQGPGPDGVG